METIVCAFEKGKRSIMPFILLLVFLSGSISSNAQFYQRVYANSSSGTDISPDLLSGLLAAVSDPSNAVDGNIETASELFTTTGGLGLVQSYQNVRFPTADLPATPSTPVMVKIETGGSLVDLIGGIEVQATLNGVPTGLLVDDSNLLTLLGGSVLSSGKNIFEISFVPNALYDGVRVKVSPLAGIGVVAKLYHAYFLKPATSTSRCDAPVDVLYGVNGSIANVLDGISNPYAALSGTTPPSRINTGATVAGNIYETVVFSGAMSGTAEMTISIPPSTVSASVLNQISLELYHGDALVAQHTLNSLLSLDLLGLLQNGNTVTFRSPGTVTFDRVRIGTTGVISAFADLSIHEVRRLLPPPTVTTGNHTIYLGQTASLTAASLHSSDFLRWRNAAGNTPLATGSPFNVSPLHTTDYQVTAALSQTCPTESSPAIARVTVLLPPDTFTNPAAGTAGSPYSGFLVASGGTPGQNLTYAASDPSNLPPGIILNPDGTIKGTPTRAGTFSIPVVVTNSDLGLIAVTHTYQLVIQTSLPVELSDFMVQREGNTALITWTTVSETNSKWFGIERSGDGKQWILIGNMPAGIESKVVKTYRFADLQPGDGINYYRLKMVDLDDTFAYSSMKTLDFDPGRKTDLPYPNPANEWVNVSRTVPVYTDKIEITDLRGIKVWGSEKPDTSINVSKLTNGIYILKLVTSEGSVITNRIVIKH